MQLGRLILSAFALGCFITTIIPGPGGAQADKVKAAMADLKAETEKLGAPKVEGKELYFGTTKMDVAGGTDIQDPIIKKHGGGVTLFVKSGNDYVRVVTSLKKEDGSSAVGTALEATNPAVAKLNNGDAYYGEATVFGKVHVVGYEPIKDASGSVIGAYGVGQPK